MFSLKNKKKGNPKPEETNQPKDDNKQQNKTMPQKQKPLSKKVGKTVFEDPFYYRMYFDS